MKMKAFMRIDNTNLWAVTINTVQVVAQYNKISLAKGEVTNMHLPSKGSVNVEVALQLTLDPADIAQIGPTLSAYMAACPPDEAGKTVKMHILVSHLDIKGLAIHLPEIGMDILAPCPDPPGSPTPPPAPPPAPGAPPATPPGTIALPPSPPIVVFGPDSCAS